MQQSHIMLLILEFSSIIPDNKSHEKTQNQLWIDLTKTAPLWLQAPHLYKNEWKYIKDTQRLPFSLAQTCIGMSQAHIQCPAAKDTHERLMCIN